MEVNLVKIINGELLKLYKLPITKYTVIAFVILQFFIFKDASQFYLFTGSDVPVNTQLISILLLNIVVLAPFIIIIFSSILIGIEYEKKMWGINLTKISYIKLILIKILTLCSVCFLVSAFTFFLGCICLKIYNYSLLSLNFKVLFFQFWNVTLVSIFLGLVTFSFSIWFKNSLSGIIISLLITQVEPMFYQYSNNLKLYLPYWNIRGILSKAFDNLTSNDYMIILPDNYRVPLECILFLSFFLLIIVYFVLKKAIQEEFE